MGLGILEARSPFVPGTVNVYDSANRDDTTTTVTAETSTGKDPRRQLKYDRSGSVPIILVPQPSDDPNDPLNWPLWKRDFIITILSITSVIASTISPLLAANTVTLSLDFRRDFSEMALLTGYNLCGVGVAGLIFVASARVWGKRHLYILGTALVIAASVWGGKTVDNYSYKSLLWARVIQGVGLAPFEALVNATVGDLYFVHERGKRMALTNLAVFGGAFFTPVLVGKITHSIGWPWSFYLIAIFAGAMFPFVILFVPETAYKRDDALNTDITGEQELGGVAETQPAVALASSSTASSDNEKETDTPTVAAPAAATTPTSTTYPPRNTFLHSLRLFTGRKTDTSFFKLLIRPFPLFAHPAILWATLTQGTLIGWTVMIGVVLAAIFLGPPLWFDEQQTGYMYAGPTVGAVLGFLLSGILADVSAKILTRRNKGVYEPEFRIVLVLPQLICGTVGLFGFGRTAASVTRYGWFWPAFFFAAEVMGMVIGAVASALYIVDAHRDIAVEAFTCLLLFKNMFSFGLTERAYDWIRGGGIARIFYIIGAVQIVICSLSLPMYILGKRNRYFFYKNDILKALHLA